MTPPMPPGSHDDRWYDLIPFYAAGTLPMPEARTFEAHLAACAECQRVLQEWRIIAGVVQAEGRARGRSLPPLSRAVRDQVEQEATPLKASANGHHAAAAAPVIRFPDQPRPAGTSSRASEPTQQSMRPMRFPVSKPRTSQRAPVPITLAAVMTAVLIVGGLLIFTLARQPVDEIDTASSNPAAADAVALHPSPTPSPTRTRIVSTPTNTVTPILDLLPTVIPLPSVPPSGTGGGGGVEAAGGFVWVAPQATPFLKVDSATCALTNMGTQPIQIYQEAQPESMITGLFTPGAVIMIVLVSEDGWVRVATQEGVHLGWVFASGQAFTPPCSNMLTPTPTDLELLPVPTLLIPTPTAGYGAAIGRDTFDFVIVSSDVVGLPANSRVRISSAYYTGSEWIYSVVARSSSIVAEVREWQLRWMPESGQPITAPTATITPDTVPPITLTPR